jgi:hypothetical protein
MAFSLKFKVTRPTKLTFNYVLASRELPRYMGRKYNDEFRMELNGDNIALLPDRCHQRTIGKFETNRPIAMQSQIRTCPFPANSTAKDAPKDRVGNLIGAPVCPVSVQNLGQNQDNSDMSWSSCYVNNPIGRIFRGYTGYTVPLQASASVEPNVDYTLNISIKDVADGQYDSVVFLEKGSLYLATRRSADAQKPKVSSGSTQQPLKELARHQPATSNGHSSTALIVAACSGLVVGVVVTLTVVHLFHRRHSAAMTSSDTAIVVSAQRHAGEEIEMSSAAL